MEQDALGDVKAADVLLVERRQYSHRSISVTTGGRAYVDRLVKYVSDRRITMEVCPTSNLNTMPDLRLEDHALKTMVENRVSISIGTDNRLVSNTTVCRELRLAVDTFQLSPKQLKEIVICGFKRSFYAGPYTQRRAYVRKVMDFYDAVSLKHGVPLTS